MNSLSSSIQKRLPVVLAPKGSEGERSEPERTVGASTTAAIIPASPSLRTVPANPEVVAKATRRRFTVDYKLKLLEQADPPRRTLNRINWEPCCAVRGSIIPTWLYGVDNANKGFFKP
jgi:hypothetical protein